MKKLAVIFTTALLALFSASCSSGGDDPPSISSDSQNNIGNFENPGQITNMETEKPYTGNGKIYMSGEKRDSNDQPILTAETMVEAGVMNKGKITFALPKNVDSRFLLKIDYNPPGIEVKPLGVEVWFYVDPFRLLSNGKHIGNLEYAKILNDGTSHKITYCYFSKDANINGHIEVPELSGVEYKVEAKKGWNKIYLRVNINTGSFYATTNLNEAPDGLKWIVEEK